MIGFRKELYNLRYFFGKIFHASPAYVVTASIGSVLEAVSPFVGIFALRYIMDELTGQRRVPLLTFYVLAAVGLACLLGLVLQRIKRYGNTAVWDIVLKIDADLGQHNMEVSYDKLEDNSYIELKSKADLPIKDRFLVWVMARYLPDTLRYLLTAVAAFGIICTLDLVSIVLVAVPILITTLLNWRFQEKDRVLQQEYMKMDREFSYYYELMHNFSAGKDIRLFRFDRLLMAKNDKLNERVFAFKLTSGKLKHGFEGVSQLLTAARSTMVYGYIACKAILSSISIGSFSMYVGAAAAFSDAATSLFANLMVLRQDCRYLEDYVKLSEIPTDNSNSGVEPPAAKEITLEFREVSFRYPGAKANALDKVSFILTGCESCSLVGRNGAGKTTVIKLLARLLKPTEGQILVNGADINTISFEKYRELFAVVFQDFRLFEWSVAENISAGEPPDSDRLEKALAGAGMLERVEQLPEGVNSYVGKQFDPDGTEFSGGELQKLAIARASYKGAPVIVLDEPTAALDPLAEAEVYSRFHSLTGNKTTVYISHRLSSCRFCHRIILLEDGKITEQGDHNSLMELGGQYAEMFTLQASKYLA